VNVIVLPVLFEGQVKAVIELASFHKFSDIHLTFFDQLTEIIGIMLNTITATMRTEELLKQSQSLATELQSRQAQLTETNAQLQQQARTLRESEERLKAQQEELQQTNEELEEKARLLFQQNREVERKNAEIEKARASLEDKAAQLALTSKYKSEFLANMSHELRTPLNSMLILSRLLAENEDRNLSEKQVEYAQTIHASGDDLLQLINEVLDLSKVESGTMEIENKRVLISEIRDFVQKNFEAVATSKGVKFSFEARRSVPRAIFTDQGRLQQILKNLLSNAFKFTDEGGVTFRIETVTEGWSRGLSELDAADQVVAFSVIDTGIGIPADKHRIIFEAFQQADGTITRKYGGTGLGLSISRGIAQLLGGEIRVESEPGKGSTFTLFLPRRGPSPLSVEEDAGAREGSRESSLPKAGGEDWVSDDRENIQEGDRVLAVVSPEPDIGQRILNMAREHGFKVVIESDPDRAFGTIRDYSPDAITLVGDDEGWLILDHLKHDLRTSHIPVHVIGDKSDRQRALNLGALALVESEAGDEALVNSIESLKSFIARQVKNLLIVEDDDNQRKALEELIGDGDVQSVAETTGDEALEALRTSHFDCMVVDLGLPDMSGFDLIEKLKKDLGLDDLPVIVYTAKDLSSQEETRLRKLAESIVIKDARSLERLLAETSLFLHRRSSRMSPKKLRMLEDQSKLDPILEGRKVLVIDDDVRNIFSLTSLLERHHMEVMFAENGRDGLEILNNSPDVDAILVDVMMPDMDGYETMREIRKMRRFKKTPVIALTAKAMKGDRDKCIAAGASDYISKPAEVDRLLSLLRMYLNP
jgi:signal transduction histidine kinase/CheY-like chemotaxis protein